MAKALSFSSSGALRALNLAFPLRPLGFFGGGEDSDSLDTSVSEPWLSLGSPGVSDPVRTEQILLTMVWQRLQHKSPRQLKSLALMLWSLGHLGLDGQAIHIWPPC